MKNEAKSYSVKMYAEMVLEDGRVIATEDDDFLIGSKVFAVSDDGEASALSAGSYTMENGSKITIGENSEILDLGEEKEAADIETSEDLAEEDEAAVDDWAGMEKRIKNLEDAVADLKADKVEASAEVIEETEEDKTEMSKENDFLGELMTEIEDLRNKVVELSGEPAEEDIKYNPEGEHFSSTIDLSKLSAKERAAYYINNK